MLRHTTGSAAARMLTVAGAPLLVLVATAACTARPVTSTAPASGAPAASASADPHPSGGPGTGPSDGTSQVAACASGDLKADVIFQRSSGPASIALVQLTNVSKHECRLAGWATVTLVNAAAQPVPVPTSKVSEPGAPTPVELRPGTTASSGIKWTTCDKGADDCGVGNSLTVSPPNGTTSVPATLVGFPAPEKSGITMKLLQIGSIQPSAQGVVAW